MKRHIIGIILALLALSAACQSTNSYHPLVESLNVDEKDFFVNMEFEDFCDLVDPRETVGILSHYYFIDRNGQAITISFNDGENGCYERAVAVHVCPSNVVSNAQWNSIRPGMKDYEVVALVGIPFRIEALGMITMDFISTEGDVYRIEWTTKMEVVAVEKLDENVFK